MHIFYAALVALGFAAAPLITRSNGAKIPVMVTALVVSIGSLIVFLPAAAATNWKELEVRPIAVSLVAGLANGTGLFALYALVNGAAENKWSFTLVPIGLMAMIALMSVGGSMLYADPFTAKKAIGIALAAIAIWLLH